MSLSLSLWRSWAAVALALTLTVGLAYGQTGARGWSSGRPAECSAPAGGSANGWERAKSPERGRYCDLVASAASKLAGNSTMAQAALALAREADEALPGSAAPRVLEGRALAALGKFDDALVAFRDALGRDAAALDDPLALHAWARVLARTGHHAEATAAYRILLPRTMGLSSADRATSAVEAGLVGMEAGPAAIDEAVAALREALRDGVDDVIGLADLALALALDRRGDVNESRAVLAVRARQISGDPRVELEQPRAKEILVVAPSEAPAIAAIALEVTDPYGARDAWEQYLSALERSGTTARASWRAHALAHLAAMTPRPPRSR